MDKVSISEQWQQLLATSQPHPHSETVLYGSQFVAHWGERWPEKAAALLASGDILRAYEKEAYQQKLKNSLADVTDEVSLHKVLRQFRQREMSRIIWRDLAGLAEVVEIMADLSHLADACIAETLSLLDNWLSCELGIPYGQDSQQRQYMVVLAMGKLGAEELNLSSDVDLIFTYPEQGMTRGGKVVENEVFFTRLGQALIQALDKPTVEGFVFRVDMRLRPFGDSGALVSCFNAIEDYYQTQGREWERYAMIKARTITGKTADRERLVSLLKPFVYRRYLDYGVFSALRNMKAGIVAELSRKGIENNIKLGAGGIREIEFVGQVFQLIYGGRDIALQQRSIILILDLLVERESLSIYAATDLKQAYIFLRRLEHRIQAFADKQTHQLPTEHDAQKRIAFLMGYQSTAPFFSALDRHRQAVKRHFSQLLTIPQAEQNDDENVHFFSLSIEQQSDYLSDNGFSQVDKITALLNAFVGSRTYKNLNEVEHQRAATLLPLLINAAASVSNPDNCIQRVIPFVEKILRRSAYMSLLVENSLALSQLIQLCAASPWISERLAKHPILLDELLDPRSLYKVPSRDEQQKKLEQYIDHIEEDDLEQQMDLLREYRQVATLHVAAADVTDVLPLMQVGDQLSDLAEIIINKVMLLAWRYLVAKHGYPPCSHNDDMTQCGFTVLAYGKLGGLELAYGSDLDLVFLYDDDRNQGETNGEKPVDVLMFYTRLAQRIVHFINRLTSNGVLYEVDLRLRPNGQSGLLVAPLSGFERYQQQSAWTWEHQALVRARCVAGDLALTEKIAQTRLAVLAKKRDIPTLIHDVTEMRDRMRKQLDKSTTAMFDLKQGQGGIADIEFLVQYATLAWSWQCPALLTNTDNIRILDSLAAFGKLTHGQCEQLAEAYRFFRQLTNRCVLQAQSPTVPVAQVAASRRIVIACWQHWFSGNDSLEIEH